MTASRDPDRLIHRFLLEGEEQLQDQVYDAVRAEIEQRRQRAVVGSRGVPDMNKFLAVGLAAAAVAVIAVIAFNLLPGSPAPGGEPSATPEPSAAEPSTAEPSAESGLPVGSSHVLLDEGVTITVTVPAPGWFGDVGILTRESVDPPDGAGIITFTGDLYVYGNPCQWSTTKPETPSTTVDELVSALSSRIYRASAPVGITVDGYEGKSITLQVPEDATHSAGEFTACDQGQFSSWGTPAEDAARHHQGPGQIDELWILDVDGVLVVIDIAYYAGTPAEHVDEMRAIADSATFELP